MMQGHCGEATAGEDQILAAVMNALIQGRWTDQTIFWDQQPFGMFYCRLGHRVTGYSSHSLTRLSGLSGLSESWA